MMTIEPTAEDSARHILDVFRAHTLRIGRILPRGSARLQFLAQGDWHIHDFVSGLQYASRHHWIAMPSPTVLKLTEDGFSACRLPGTAPSPSRGLGI
jgi:hypothetical protein